MIYDAIIIGAGPAGLTAGMYMARAGKKTLVVESYAAGGQIARTPDVENYPGLAQISGLDLASNIQAQAERFGAKFIYDNITSLNLTDDIKKINTEYSGSFSADNVILAMGAKPRRLGLPEEEQLIGQGISYCATCDGNFFKDKTVGVVGGGDTALTEALFLNDIAKKVYIVHRRDEYRGSKDLSKRIKDSSIIELLDSQIIGLVGNPLSNMKVKHNKTKEISTIEVDGLFISVGNIPQSDIAKDVVTLENGYIVTDEDMKTNIKGVYAIGDVRKKRLRQVVTACADGAIAATHIYEELSWEHSK